MLLFKIWPVSIGNSLSFHYKFPCPLANCNEILPRGVLRFAHLPFLPHHKLVAHPIVLINVDTWAITAHIDVNPIGIGIEGLGVHQDASGVIDVRSSQPYR